MKERDRKLLSLPVEYESLLLTLLIGDRAGGFAGGLAGRLALAAATLAGGFLQIGLIQCFNVFHFFTSQ